MTRRYIKLSRRTIRALLPGEGVSESGITATRVANGDIRYSVNVMVDGTRHHRVVGYESDGTTRTQAEELIAKLKAETRENRLSLPKGRKTHLTYGKAADLYLTKLEEAGARDYVNNEQHLRLHLKPELGGIRLDRVTKFTLETFRKTCREKGLAESTINLILATHRRMARRLPDWLPGAPLMPTIPLSSVDNARDYVLTHEEEQQLLRAALADSHPYIHLFVQIGLATALRHQEIVSLRFEDLDAPRRRIRVKVKGGRWRSQPLTRSILKVLLHERHMAEIQDGWVFPAPGSPIGHITTLGKPFARCVKAAGMDPKIVTPHIMRHSALTRFADAEPNLKTFMAFSGHKSIEAAMRYIHARDHKVDDVLDRMEGRTVISLDPKQRKSKSAKPDSR